MVAAPNCGPDEDPNQAYLTVYIGSRIPGALNFLRPLVDESWENFEPGNE